MKTPIYQLPSLSADQLPYLNTIISHISHAINNIEFGTVDDTGSHSENIWCTFVVVDGGGANVACSSSHSLGKKPIGTIVIWQDKAAVMYKPTDATSADTATEVFYIFDTAATSAVLLLI